MTFYNQHGQPIAYLSDDCIYSYTGRPLGYLTGDNIYSFGGKHLGCLREGWVRDHNGAAVFFTEGSFGGPVQPVRQVQPVKRVRQIQPVRSVRQNQPIKPVMSVGWSDCCDEDFFE